MSRLSTFNLSSLKTFHKTVSHHLTTKLWAKILAGFALGLLFGLFLKQDFPFLSQSFILNISDWLLLPGQLFLRLVQMIVIPLVFASVVRGIAGSDNVQQLKRLGLRLIIYFIFTTTIAIIIGATTALIIQPDKYIQPLTQSLNSETPSPITEEQIKQTGLDQPLSYQIISLLPENPISAMNDGELLQIVLFAIIFGLALIVMNSRHTTPLLTLLEGIQEVCLTIVKWAMYLAPVAVFGMMANTILTTGQETLFGLLVYIVTVTIALLLMVLVYLILLLTLTNKSPIIFLKKIFPVQLLAFSTSSSAAVMPLSIKTAQEDLKISPSVSEFTIPLGATINMDGTALYQMVAIIFLAGAYQVDLSLSQMIIVGITAVGASIGAPGTPGVGIVILATLLQSVGIPLSGISLILTVDRILDMCRTAVNVTGDLTAASIMEKWGKKKNLNPL
jgi:Na+/H+-dicarboxylate symporter